MELGEVEFHIQQIVPEGMEVCADIVISPTKKYRPKLAGYIELGSSNPNYADEIAARVKAGLLEKLLSYMLPSDIYVLKEFPKMASSGKMNRKKLRDISDQKTLEQLSASSVDSASKQMPRSDMELEMLLLVTQGNSPITTTRVGYSDG